MASNIIYDSIDKDFPVAGKDNDSQGFRDNFGIIQTSLQSAKGEIEDLQINVAKKNSANDFANNNILRARFVNCSEVTYSPGPVNTTTVVDYAVGSYQKFQVTAGMQFTIGNFPPSGSYAKLTIELTGDDSSHAVVFGLTGNGSIKKGPNATILGSVSVSSADNPKIFEFWTISGGNVVFMEYLGTFI
jgi:hypothetical protein